MTAAMGRLRFTKLLILTLPLVAAIVQVEALSADQIEPTRVKRDVDGVTTVLLVSAQQGKSAPPVGVLSKTARTFVQDGASTEFATQIVGTTLDNGRLYARILSTSSRVFYDKEPSPDSVNPYLVYPSQSSKSEWQFKYDLDNAGSQKNDRVNNEDGAATTVSDVTDFSPGENDIINRSESPIDLSIFKPAKVRPAENLPTYTVKQEYVLQGKFDTTEEDEQSAKSRIPKVFRSQPKISTKKPESRNLATVTYHGFADFTTTVGDTVMVFSPSTSSALAGRPATTIKGDATLRPNDGVAVMKIKPTSVLSPIKPTQTFFHRNRGQNDSGSFRKSGKAASINSFKLQPSLSEVGSGPKAESTTPLLYVPGVATESLQPTGLLEVVDSTTSSDGTTTHFKSMIYGTYVGNNYKQIIHTSSYVYFYPDETTAAYGTEATTEDYMTTDTTETDLDSTITTMGTTPSLKDLEEDDLTTPYEETTEANPTTVKSLFNLNRAKLFKKKKPGDNEVNNDVVPNNQLGRSVQRGSQKNNVNPNDKDSKPVSLSTRIVPSTLYTTFTYFTTFFFSDSLDHTTTSVKSREVVSSEVSYLPEVIAPTETQTVPPSGLSTKSPTITADKSNTKEVKQEDEQIELIFKTLYTTYTYLTTFFEESTTSISSREVVETNVITQTVGTSGVSALFSNEVSSISPTKIRLDESSNYVPTQNSFYTDESTEESLTTVDDLFTTVSDEAVEDDKLNDMKKLEPSFSSTSGKIREEYLKTYYTTYTYFTTIFVDDETEIETRTEVFSNIVTEKIQPTAVVPKPVLTQSPTSKKTDKASSPPPEILAYLEALKKKKSEEEALSAAKKAQGKPTKEKNQPSENVQKSKAKISTTEPIDGEVLSSMVTDVVSSSSSGGETLLDISDKKNMVPEDQELSESNHHDVEPVPTLLLQTSYTTFTYFTTMYKGDASNVVSRLETVTNVVTETIRPSVVFPEPSTTLPVTYFTTFTYWTTFYKGGDTVITSREETVSNVVTPGVSPTPTLQLDVVKTYRPFVDATPVNDDYTPDGKLTEDNELPNKDNESTLHEILTTNVNENSITPSTVNAEPATVYTTFTYFTTSYVGDSTVVNSRLETITNILKPNENQNQITGRAIGSGIPTLQVLNVNDKPVTKISPSSVSPTTGLISTIRSSLVNDGTTTHYMTDVYGTYIDGLYAQVVQSSTKLETATPSVTATPTIPTGILSLNKGSIVDADEVTTVYYTTKEIGTLIDGLYAKVIESSTSTNIDSSKLATLSPTAGHRTGLVRLIKGQIEANDTTIFYQSKVIGTSIENRYAQIIESTSSYVINPSTVHSGSLNTPAPHLVKNGPAISPSPAAVQSSLSDDSTLDNSNNDDPNSEGDESENEENEEDDDKSTKKSRLTFSSRKRTFTPVIRPFASRARPTFNPKRKNVQGATTITRTDITPTITATLAGKSNRFSSSRNRVSSPIGPYSSTLNPSNARRFSGRRSSTSLSSVNPSSSISGSSRTRGTPRISPSSSFNSARRGPSSIRGSSARPAIKGSSTLLGSSSRFRANIRPSSTLQRSSLSTRLDDQEDNANEFTTTTLVTDESLFTSSDQEGATSTPPLQTTTENPRRSSSPLLRFRRPLTNSGRQSTTPRSTTTTASPKRFSNKKNITNTSNRINTNRGSVRATSAPISTRPRQSSNGLFPPRGFLNKKPEETSVNQAANTSDVTLEDHPVEEITDNDYEGSENEETPTSTVPSRKLDTIKIRPFSASYRARRFRRQTSQLRSASNRFRRPATSLEERIDSDVSLKEDTSQLLKSQRFGSRGRSLSNTRPSFKSYVNDKSDEYDDNNQYYTNQMNLRDRAKSVSRNTVSRINPTATVGSNRQFTLREKDSSSTVRPTYKRPTASRGRTDNLLRTRNNSRTRNGSIRTLGDTTNNRRLSNSRSSGRGRNNNRLRSSARGKSSFEDIRQAPFYEPDTDGTITVTHYVPTEVTIPVVNKGVTEHRNIITAQPSTEILGPHRYSTVIGGDGRQLVVIATESTGTNPQGEIEITRFVLHETPTTRVSHTLTTFGGRRASQSIIVPTTIYSVENVVSTIRPSLTSANAPLANILLSQLLLGQFGQQNANALLQGVTTQATPTTKYDTRTTTYVTTLTKHQSTVIPLTFRGKEILTTLVDTSTNVVTATEFITDTVVVTPTAVLPAANLNSLLHLLQQPQQPLLDPLVAAAPLLTQSNTLPGEVERRNQPVDFDYKPDSYEYSEEDDEKTKSAGRTDGKSNENKDDKSGVPSESSVVTLYVSGKRPGEFSTVLSTVKVGEESTALNRRRKAIEQNTIIPSVSPSLNAAPHTVTYTLSASEEPINAHTPTESLESVVDTYRTALSDSDGRHVQYDSHNNYHPHISNDDTITNREYNNDGSARKSVKIRVPVVRSRNARQHAVTVVRRRPVVPYSELILPTSTFNSPRTNGRSRVRDPSSYDDIPQSKVGRHKVTITRRRKISPSTTETHRERVTRKKLVNVRPVPRPTLAPAIITTGFYTAPADDYDYDDDYSSIDYNHYVSTPKLEDTSKPYTYKPRNTYTKPVVKQEDEIKPSTQSFPIIITDNFFFPSKDDKDPKVVEDDVDIKFTTENVLETTTEEEYTIQPTTFAPTEKPAKTTPKSPEIQKPISSADIQSPESKQKSKPSVNELNSSNASKYEVDDKNSRDRYVTITNVPQRETETPVALTTELPEYDDESQTDPPRSDTRTTKKPIEEEQEYEITEIPEEDLTVKPIEQDSNPTVTVEPQTIAPTVNSSYTEESYVPSVIPLEDISRGAADETQTPIRPSKTVQPIVVSSSENTEFESTIPQILPSTSELSGKSSNELFTTPTPELGTSVYYTETTVTSTKLRTYTYVVTKQNGLETEVTSSTTVRPKVTVLTLRVPVTITLSPVAETTMMSTVNQNNPDCRSENTEKSKGDEKDEEEGRRFNLATRVMKNGVEVIVAGPTPALRWENSNMQPTLTLSDAVVMLLPQERQNEFVTKTCTTTFTYLNTITKDGTTIVTTDQQVIANTATEERHRKPASEAAAYTLETSPTLHTEVFKTTYKYLTLNTDHPDENNALESSSRVIMNTVTAPQYYLDMILEPSESSVPETNTYFSTRVLEKTLVEQGVTKIDTISDTVTKLIITESGPTPKPTSVATTVTALDNSSALDMTKTYYITYTYYNTYLENDSTVVRTNIATSTDVVLEKSPARKTSTKQTLTSATPEPIQIFATKTYLTTYTYFTTLLQAGTDGETSTTISSRSHIVENVVTESIAPSLLDAGYMNALLTSSHYSDSVKNVVTGSTIIFFDNDDQIKATPTTAPESTPTISAENVDKDVSQTTVADQTYSETNDVTLKPVPPENEQSVDESSSEISPDGQNTQPAPSGGDLQMSNLLSLGSLGINSLSALGPVITAMAGLLQGKSSATRRNDTAPITAISETVGTTTTTQRSPIYIPVADFVDGDIETAESQNIGHLAKIKPNHLPETRHKVTASLSDGIPISPGEIILANSDVIIGKPGKMAPRPPNTFRQSDEHVGLKPPPLPVPKIPVHPVLEVLDQNRKPEREPGKQNLEIVSAHQVYEDHIKQTVPSQNFLSEKQSHLILHPVQSQSSKSVSSKYDILDNDPLLIPPSKSNQLHVNNVVNQGPDPILKKWSSKDPFSSSSNVETEIKVSVDGGKENHWQDHADDKTENLDDDLRKSKPPKVVVHQVPHVIDRGSGQSLLVNIQPSQVANVVIPQGGTQALIYGDTNEPHISGQYFDEPSPHPESDQSFYNGKIDGTHFVTNYGTKNQKLGGQVNLAKQPQVIPLSLNQFQGEQSTVKSDKRPFDRFPIRRPGILNNNQGHVQTEILVHHKPEMLNNRHHVISHPNLSPQREHTLHKPIELSPPRRTEISPSSDSIQDHVLFGKPPIDGDKNLSNNKKSDKKLLRPPNRRPRPPSVRPRPPYRGPISGPNSNRPNRIDRPHAIYPTRLPPKIENELTVPPRTVPYNYNKIGNYDSNWYPNYTYNGAADLPQKPAIIFDNQPPVGLQESNSVANKTFQSPPLIMFQPASDQVPTGAVEYYNPHFNQEDKNRQDDIKPEEDKNHEPQPEVENENEDEEPEDEQDENDSNVEASDNVKTINYVKNEPEVETKNVSDLDNRGNYTWNLKVTHEDEENEAPQERDPTDKSFETLVIDSAPMKVDVEPDQGSKNKTPDFIHPVRRYHTNNSGEPNGHGRPFSIPPKKEQSSVQKENIDPNQYQVKQTISVDANTVKPTNKEQNLKFFEGYRNQTSHQDKHVLVHPEYPHILTKPRPKVPNPVIVSSGNSKNTNAHARPIFNFSAKPEEGKVQPERPSLIFSKHSPVPENPLTNYQFNFGNDVNKKVSVLSNPVPSQDMVPPPRKLIINPKPSIDKNVVGLSPPPIHITTTSRPKNSDANEAGLRPPPLYIPLKDNGITLKPPTPKVSMTPPEPSHGRPFLADILSEDMIPPPMVTNSQLYTNAEKVKPSIMTSGSIQIATAVATSHIPVVQDIESKIPIVHGTVDLPVVVGVPAINRVSVYTVKPFETKPSRSSIQPTTILTTSLAMPSIIKPSVVDDKSEASSREEPESDSSDSILTYDDQHDFVHLEPSTTIVVPTNQHQSTESLESSKVYSKSSVQSKVSESVKPMKSNQKAQPKTTASRSNQKISTSRLGSTKVERTSSTREPKPTRSYGTTSSKKMKSKEVTRYETSTITRTDTSILGYPPSTRTLLITHTLTSTQVETVTETLVRPTSVISTVTSTIIHPVTNTTYEEDTDNDSIFVVLSDQKPPELSDEEVEAEYGDEEITRDEQDETSNEVHRVLAGSTLGASIVPVRPPTNHCSPECKSAKFELCASIGDEMRCICRPGFARLFPDRPCKSKYTYVLRLGMDRVGQRKMGPSSIPNDTSSMEHKQLAMTVKDSLDRTMMQSDLRDVYLGTIFAGFVPRYPVEVRVYVQLNENTDQSKFNNIIKKYLLANNFSLGGTDVYASNNLSLVGTSDFDECTTKEGGPYHDCSMNAACFNLWGTYKCSCKEGWADLSESSAYAGRVCSQAPLGCANCNNKGHCVTNAFGQESCECFSWYSGQKCQVNLKVLLIALVTTGAILFGLLMFCVGMACYRHPNKKRTSCDRRAMIPRTGCDSSSEGSITELAIPHHVPHVLPPPPQMIAPTPPMKKPMRRVSKQFHSPQRKPAPLIPNVSNSEQRDRSLTVMIPRAKYRSAPQNSQSHKPMSTFSAEEHKLIDYLDNGTYDARKVNTVDDFKEAEIRPSKIQMAPSGALVSAGFQVSATVTRMVDAESTIIRSCGESTLDSIPKVYQTTDYQGDLESTLMRSCGEASIQPSTKTLLRVDLGEAGSTLARSCGETTIQPSTKLAGSDRKDNRDMRDSASEGHTMAERDLGSTLRLPAQHPPLYNSDRAISDRESNFDSL